MLDSRHRGVPPSMMYFDSIQVSRTILMLKNRKEKKMWGDGRSPVNIEMKNSIYLFLPWASPEGSHLGGGIIGWHCFLIKDWSQLIPSHSPSLGDTQILLFSNLLEQSKPTIRSRLVLQTICFRVLKTIFHNISPTTFISF